MKVKMYCDISTDYKLNRTYNNLAAYQINPHPLYLHSRPGESYTRYVYEVDFPDELFEAEPIVLNQEIVAEEE